MLCLSDLVVAVDRAGLIAGMAVKAMGKVGGSRLGRAEIQCDPSC